MLTILTLLSLTVAAPNVTPAPKAAPGDGLWAQWRGPERDGSVAGAAWPEALDPDGLTELWRADDLGPSYAGPVVGPERVYSVETLEEEREVVRAFDRATGEELWSTSWEGAMEVPFFAARNGSWIRATPALDGDALYVAGMLDVLVCLEAATGEVRWRVDFPARHGTPAPAFGFVSSPLVAGEHVYVQAGGALIKLNKSDGSEVWRSLVDGGGMESVFSSPVLVELSGRTQLLALSRTHMHGVDPETGAELWAIEVPSFRGMNILTPQVHGDAVFTAPYGGRAQLLEVTQAEQGFAVSRAWENRAQGYMTSPVIIGDHAYLFLRSNRFACIDLSTGEDAWISGPTGDSYWSLVHQGDRILALSDTGVLRLIRATPEAYEVLSEVEVADDSWAHLAVVDGALFVRNIDALIALALE